MLKPFTIDPVNEALLLENALLRAREAVRDEPLYRKYNPNLNKFKYDPYFFCKKGWAGEQNEGRYQSMVDALRQHVPGGDLTGWWRAGRSKREMLGLFSKAIESLPVLELA